MKFFKVSLAASIALSALGTASFAQSLEEAIKGVDVSGYLKYEYEDNRFKSQDYITDNDGAGSVTHTWTAESIFKTPVVDALSVELGLRYGGENNVNHGKGIDPTHVDGSTLTPQQEGMIPNGANAFLGEGLGSGYDSNFGVSTFKLNITPESTATNVALGKMYLDTPVTDGGEDRGVGILALNSDVPNWTFAAGVFDSWSIDDVQDSLATVDKVLYTVAAIGGYETGFGNIDIQAWYFGIQDAVKSLVFTQLGYEYVGAHLRAQYAFANLDDGTSAIYNGLNTKNDLYTVEAGFDLTELTNIGLSFLVGYMGNTQDGYAVSLDNEGAFQKVGNLWFENAATGVSISALPGSEGVNLPANTDDQNNKLKVIYANLSYAFPFSDTRSISVGVDYVYGENKLNNRTYTDTTNNNTAAAIGSGKVKFQEISPTLVYQHSDALSFTTYYAMLQSKRSGDIFPALSDEAAVPDKDKENKNQFYVEIIYNF